MPEVSMEPNQILIQNIKTLLWLGNRHNTNRSYVEYIQQISVSCRIKYETFMDIIQGSCSPTPHDLTQIVKTLGKLGYELDEIETKALFPDLKETAGEELMDLNIQYLIHSIPRGQQKKFVETIGMNPSTLCRWKQRKTKPDTYAKQQIAAYFGFETPEDIMLSFLFLGLEPYTDKHRRLYCQNQIDQMETEAFQKIYPALLKLLK